MSANIEPAIHLGDSLEPSVKALRAIIVKAVPSLNKNNQNDWWLLGTIGCHLCEVAEDLLQRFQSVQPISYQHIDIADFDEELMMHFATTIPVILTPTQRLDYPFSIVDLQRLLSANDNYKS